MSESSFLTNHKDLRYEIATVFSVFCTGNLGLNAAEYEKHWSKWEHFTAQENEVSCKGFLLRSHLVKKSLMENFIFCAVFAQNGLKTFKNDLDKNYL